MDALTFLKKVTPYAKTINPFAVLCQCYHETKVKGVPWSSELFVKANNGAGIKKWLYWPSPLYAKVSWEQSSIGIKYNKSSDFCLYPSVDVFIQNYVMKIDTSYPLCKAYKDNFLGYFNGLISGPYKWATDKEYFTRLVEASLELAPSVFGVGTAWRQKYLNALEYAIQNRYISAEQEEIILQLLKKKNVIVQPIDKINAIPKTLICIDFGHGGTDPGASSDGVLEKDCTRIFGEALGRGFSKKGFSVGFTRVNDETVSRAERAKRANKMDAGVLLSIHYNSAKPNPNPSGWEIWTTKGQNNSDILATDIYNAWKKYIKGNIRVDRSDNDPDKEENWTVLFLAKMPAVLIELGFLSNRQDRSNAQNKQWISSAVDAIIEGVETFLSRR